MLLLQTVAAHKHIFVEVHNNYIITAVQAAIWPSVPSSDWWEQGHISPFSYMHQAQSKSTLVVPPTEVEVIVSSLFLTCNMILTSPFTEQYQPFLCSSLSHVSASCPWLVTHQDDGYLLGRFVDPGIVSPHHSPPSTTSP